MDFTHKYHLIPSGNNGLYTQMSLTPPGGDKCLHRQLDLTLSRAL